MKTYLITGAAGFIGSHLSESLLSKGNTVIGIDNFDPFYDRALKEENLALLQPNERFQFIEGDIQNPETYSAIKQKVNGVVHIAAKAGVQPSLKAPKDYVDVNIQGTLQVLEWMRKNGVKNLAFASSSSVYGDDAELPFDEEAVMDHPISPYAFTKRSCELLNYNYHHLYDLSIVNLRLFTVFGPRQRPDLAIRKFIDLILRDEPIQVYGDGTTSRDYTFVKDIVAGFELSLEFLEQQEQKYYNTFNLGNSSPISLIGLIETIEKVLGKEAKKEFVGAKPGDVQHTYANISKAQRTLGYQPETSLEEGIRQFVAWYTAK